MIGDILAPEPACRCEPSFESDRLVVDADDCDGEGRLVEAAACRGTVVAALESRDVETVCTRSAGFERAYEDDAAGLLVAAGRFADAAAFHDQELAARAREDPLGAVRVASGRGGRGAGGVAGCVRVHSAIAGARGRGGERPRPGRVARRDDPGGRPSRRRPGGATNRRHCRRSVPCSRTGPSSTVQLRPRTRRTSIEIDSGSASKRRSRTHSPMTGRDPPWAR